MSNTYTETWLETMRQSLLVALKDKKYYEIKNIRDEMREFGYIEHYNQIVRQFHESL